MRRSRTKNSIINLKQVLVIMPVSFLFSGGNSPFFCLQYPENADIMKMNQGIIVRF